MAATAAIAYLDLGRGFFWAVAPVAGVALGGTWAADRPLMLRLSPPRYLGQFYGLYAMVGRFAAILGPLLWTVIVDGFGWGRPAAVLSLLVMVVISAVILVPVDDAPRQWQAGNLETAR
jgi:UMF1 family MFS transporter